MNFGLSAAIAVTALVASPLAAAPKDPDTRAWWDLIATLSSDAMRGRDTGSPEHHRAAELVAERFKAAGLQPMGDNGVWLQRVPLHEVRVETDGTRFQIVTAGKPPRPLRFLEDISIRAVSTLPDTIDAPMVFRGYCGADAITPDVVGKIVLCFGARRKNMGSDEARIAATSAAGAAGILIIDDTGFTIEPPRWPVAYARTITLRDGKEAPVATAMPIMRLNPEALPAVLAASGRNAGTILADAVAARPLPSFDLGHRLIAELTTSTRDFASENILALLPGTDPALGKQTIVINAHLDGYGIGTPVNGDGIYNGAFDDAAYVATLIRLAETRNGKGYRRPLLFAVFTGEEKGLLGSRWFVEHSTVPKPEMVASITLDAIRPLFPLKILTLIGSDKSSLAAKVERVAAAMGIVIRPDREPERGMIRRTDATPFLAAGIPSVAFMFGYDPGSREEAKFRQWYRIRYHKPQDDITQPIDFKAAADFNRFFAELTADVADADAPPVMSKAP